MSKAEEKVEYLVIGAGRSGTTTLCSHLANHPELSFSKIKEVHFFSQQDLYERGEAYLHGFFPKEGIKITADTYLLVDYKAIERIRSYHPDMKFIVLLRDPVERAVSSFNYTRNFGYDEEQTSVIESLQNEGNILKHSDVVEVNNRCHFYGGLYHRHLMEWLSAFPEGNFFIRRSEELFEDPLRVVNGFCEFAGLGKTGKLEKIQLNRNSAAKWKGFEQFLLNRNTGLRKLIRNLTPTFLKRLLIRSGMVDKLHDINRVPSEGIQLTDEERTRISLFFQSDQQKLKDLLKRLGSAHSEELK